MLAKCAAPQKADCELQAKLFSGVHLNRKRMLGLGITGG